MCQVALLHVTQNSTLKPQNREWAKDWQMLFNIDKCVVMHFGQNNKNPAVAGMDRPFVDVTRSPAVAGMADSWPDINLIDFHFRDLEMTP